MTRELAHALRAEHAALFRYVDVPGRLPDSVEVAAYYAVAEALTNTARHAHAEEVKVSVRAVDGQLNVIISDDGAGGADPRTDPG